MSRTKIKLAFSTTVCHALFMNLPKPKASTLPAPLLTPVPRAEPIGMYADHRDWRPWATDESLSAVRLALLSSCALIPTSAPVSPANADAMTEAQVKNYRLKLIAKGLLKPGPNALKVFH